jgi:hypothetical protein
VKAKEGQLSDRWRRAGAVATWLPAVVLAALLLVALGCTGDESSDASREATTTEATTTEATTTEATTTEASTEPVPPQPGLPGPVSSTRAAILEAAETGDYDRLRPLVDGDVFLSDFGFGREPDPTGRWQALGRRPLETMNVLLRMDYVVQETNEGTLYQWPRLGPDSSPDDLSARERELFSTIMTSDELEALVLPEVGYTAPRLGILADGTWWFFIMESGP